MIITKGYKFRKRSIDFAPLVWRKYNWVANRYTNPIVYKPVWKQIEKMSEKRNSKIKLSVSAKKKSRKAKDLSRKWSYLSYKHNPYKIARNLGKYLLLQQKYRKVKYLKKTKLKKLEIGLLKENKGYKRSLGVW